MRGPGVPRLRAATRYCAAASVRGLVIDVRLRRRQPQFWHSARLVGYPCPMPMNLSPADTLPSDRERALLVGRAWVPAFDGAVLVAVRGDELVDVSSVAPTASALANLA